MYACKKIIIVGFLYFSLVKFSFGRMELIITSKVNKIIIVTGLLAFRDTFLKGTEWLMLAAYSNQKIHIKQKRIISKSMSGLLSLLKSPLRNHCHAF